MRWGYESVEMETWKGGWWEFEDDSRGDMVGGKKGKGSGVVL